MQKKRKDDFQQLKSCFIGSYTIHFIQFFESSCLRIFFDAY